MSAIFSVDAHEFPYPHRFPGQASDEVILFVTRENKIMLWLRLLAVVGVALALIVAGAWFASLVAGLAGAGIAFVVTLVSILLAAVTAFVGWWWVTTLWKKSLAIITTKRLTKFIYTTPVNRHNLSLPLEMIVDTGSYTKGFIQAFLKLGTFTARSSASSSGAATDDPDRVNKKYFFIENIAMAEDLQHYVNKVLSAFRTRPHDLEKFRPFIPELKGEAREKFIQQYPEYWS